MSRLLCSELVTFKRSLTDTMQVTSPLSTSASLSFDSLRCPITFATGSLDGNISASVMRSVTGIRMSCSGFKSKSPFGSLEGFAYLIRFHSVSVRPAGPDERPRSDAPRDESDQRHALRASHDREDARGELGRVRSRDVGGGCRGRGGSRSGRRCSGRGCRSRRRGRIHERHDLGRRRAVASPRGVNGERAGSSMPRSLRARRRQ